jgi:hypothetical protein
MTVTIDEPTSAAASPTPDVDELLAQFKKHWRRREQLLAWSLPEDSDGQQLRRQILTDLIALNKMPNHRFGYKTLQNLIDAPTKVAVQAMFHKAPRELVDGTPAATDDQVAEISRRVRRDYKRWAKMQAERKELRGTVQGEIERLAAAGVGVTQIARYVNDTPERVQRATRDR